MMEQAQIQNAEIHDVQGLVAQIRWMEIKLNLGNEVPVEELIRHIKYHYEKLRKKEVYFVIEKIEPNGREFRMRIIVGGRCFDLGFHDGRQGNKALFFLALLFGMKKAGFKVSHIIVESS